MGITNVYKLSASLLNEGPSTIVISDPYSIKTVTQWIIKNCNAFQLLFKLQGVRLCCFHLLSLILLFSNLSIRNLLAFNDIVKTPLF